MKTIFTWIATDWEWAVTWFGIFIVICLASFHGLKLKREAQNAMQKMEIRLKESAAVNAKLGKTYDERLAEEYRRRGISG